MPKNAASWTLIRNGCETITCPPGTQSSRRFPAAGPGVGDVLQHLLADHHVEAARLLERGAEVELRIVQRHVLPPASRPGSPR